MVTFSSFQDTGATVCFTNRQEAGERLAQTVLAEVATLPVQSEARRFVVYALPRGGLPIAHPIARLLNCPLDVIVAKKITRPDNRELAIGAVTADGHVIWAAHRRLIMPPFHHHESALEQARSHAEAQWRTLSPTGPRANPAGAIALLVDDGIATGMTMAAAVRSLRAQQAAAIWICAPVAPPDLMPFLQELGDRVIVLATPQPFNSVSRFYEEFPQLTTEEAAAYLQD
ncbi:phosphoribosyltransferase [Leptothermofonsia sichuanensis E412]|uniref:phosphoribosyltransferase n=1 Tax=Leptothermofonsia sichuanensis TaxID=2917832 RepID=UPI001CA735FD|nr:phosphoribosyltransferase family protein [Leptothermofonsia sichuanensis]QZZ22442.1 phosphoribosyltransferase [Leptothermofonsia sichuanensis E412]